MKGLFLVLGICVCVVFSCMELGYHDTPHVGLELEVVNERLEVTGVVEDYCRTEIVFYLKETEGLGSYCNSYNNSKFELRYNGEDDLEKTASLDLIEATSCVGIYTKQYLESKMYRWTYVVKVTIDRLDGPTFTYTHEESENVYISTTETPVITINHEGPLSNVKTFTLARTVSGLTIDTELCLQHDDDTIFDNYFFSVGNVMSIFGGVPREITLSESHLDPIDMLPKKKYRVYVIEMLTTSCNEFSDIDFKFDVIGTSVGYGELVEHIDLVLRRDSVCEGSSGYDLISSSKCCEEIGTWGYNEVKQFEFGLLHELKSAVLTDIKVEEVYFINSQTGLRIAELVYGEEATPDGVRFGYKIVEEATDGNVGKVVFELKLVGNNTDSIWKDILEGNDAGKILLECKLSVVIDGLRRSFTSQTLLLRREAGIGDNVHLMDQRCSMDVTGFTDEAIEGESTSGCIGRKSLTMMIGVLILLGVVFS